MAYLQDVYREQGLFVSLPLASLGIIMTVVASIATFAETSPLLQKKKVDKSNNKYSNEEVMNQSSSSATARTVPIPTTAALVRPREAIFTAPVLVITYIFYFVFFHSLANLPLGDKLLYGTQNIRVLL
jgi:ABC-type phosphate transport system permease subunit